MPESPTTEAMLVCLLLFGPLQAPAPAMARPAIVPRDYLTLAPVDLRGRRPFQPDAVYRDHIWKLDAEPPQAGQTTKGERDEEQTWVTAKSNEQGQLSGALGYAYTTIELQQREVRLAKLSGAWTLFINGRPYFGDAYRFGFGGVPVVLRKGTNHIYVAGIRGTFALKFPGTAEGVLHGGWDDTLPHVVVGEDTSVAVGIELTNLRETATGPIRFLWEGPQIRSSLVHFDAGLPALGANQFSLPINVRALEGQDSAALTLRVLFPGVDGDLAGSPPPMEFQLDLAVREQQQTRVRTYISTVDHSTQQYAIVPPAPSGEPVGEGWMGLALSLHGASVSSLSQANCYTQRPDFWVAAPMNRRPYGFDWQDWGRRDAYDVLELALAESGVDPRNKYVTGHSMGGHGTWHLAANDLDGFAACAPSAGWESFDSYGGRPAGALAELWHAADASSRTLDLIGNLAQLPTFILHGTADNNVPASEALAMMTALTAAGGSFESHFEGGAGHWWGNRCVDWPPFFDFFRKHSIPSDPAAIDFRSVSPVIDAQHHWVRVEQPRRYGQGLRVHGSWDEDAGSVQLQTENVALLRVARAIKSATIDGQRLQLEENREQHWFRWRAGAWSYETAGPNPAEKRAQRCGPLKNAFDRAFHLVVGTGGSPVENAAMLASAQLHAGSWRYRANGNATIMTDTRLAQLHPDPSKDFDNNVILYGNRDTNSAFRLLPDECPLDVRRGRIELGTGEHKQAFEGDGLGCAFLYPMSANDNNLVGVFGSTGVDGARLLFNLQPFKSGAGYPDYTLFNAQILTHGDGGVLAAGWFDNSWDLQSSED